MIPSVDTQTTQKYGWFEYRDIHLLFTLY